MSRRSRPSVFLASAILVLSLGVCSLAQAQTYYQERELEVHDLPVLTARSHDPSDVLITSLDVIFHDKEICCGRDSALGDSAQAADPKSLRNVAGKLDGRHLLSDGRPIKMTAEFLTPDAISAGQVVSTIAKQHAALMLWNSHLYVVSGVIFVSTQDITTGATAFIIRKFLLLDTRFSGSRRTLVFDRENEDPGKVQGILFLQIETRD
jgi:hypothetical protein